MMSRLAVILSVLFVPSAADAGIIVGAVSATTDMGTSTDFGFRLDSAIDQRGLSSGYTTGDDLDTYLSSNPTHNSTVNSNSWLSQLNNNNGVFDLDLGGMYTINRLFLWSNNDFNSLKIDIDDNAGFTSPFRAASFGAISGTSGTDHDPLVKSPLLVFAPVQASHIRLHVNSGGQFAGIGEIAFGAASTTAVPEPSSLVLMIGICVIGLVGYGWRHRRARTDSRALRICRS